MSCIPGGKKTGDESQDMVPATATASAGASAATASTTAAAAVSDTDSPTKSPEDENAFRAAYNAEDDPEGYYDEDDDDVEEEEEDLDAIIEELDNLEDITSWTGQSEDDGNKDDEDSRNS